MKIIEIDNFNRENVSDTLIATEVSSYWAPIIVNMLNDKFSGTDSDMFFKAVDDNYKLYVFEP